jgi:2-polyprenyl-3-methyl-5-hydroxy-6-metoxy-1,4-benzoquinol methylase
VSAALSETMVTSLVNAQSPLNEPPPCPVCSAIDNQVWGVKTDHVMYQCNQCGLTFFDRKLFDVHEYGNYYDYTDDWDSKRVSWELKVRRPALTRQLTQLGSYVSGRTLLDIGAGPGYLCHLAATEGWQAQGVELSEKALRIGRQFLSVNYVQLDDVIDESLDVITCYHILEHMERPDSFIKKVYSKLKPNGVVAVHVPHREPLSFSIRNSITSKNQETEKQCQLYVPEHISGFTGESLANAFKLFGFQPLLVRTSAMWGTYCDPFFLRSYVKEKKYVDIVKHTLRCLVDNVGVLVGQGDWVVGHFRKSSSKLSTRE